MTGIGTWAGSGFGAGSGRQAIDGLRRVSPIWHGDKSDSYYKQQDYLNWHKPKQNQAIDTNPYWGFDKYGNLTPKYRLKNPTLLKHASKHADLYESVLGAFPLYFTGSDMKFNYDPTTHNEPPYWMEYSDPGTGRYGYRSFIEDEERSY